MYVWRCNVFTFFASFFYPPDTEGSTAYHMCNAFRFIMSESGDVVGDASTTNHMMDRFKASYHSHPRQVLGPAQHVKWCG